MSSNWDKQIHTKASRKIAEDSYCFILMTFKDTMTPIRMVHVKQSPSSKTGTASVKSAKKKVEIRFGNNVHFTRSRAVSEQTSVAKKDRAELKRKSGRYSLSDDDKDGPLLKKQNLGDRVMEVADRLFDRLRKDEEICQKEQELGVETGSQGDSSDFSERLRQLIEESNRKDHKDKGSVRDEENYGLPSTITVKRGCRAFDKGMESDMNIEKTRNDDKEESTTRDKENETFNNEKDKIDNQHNQNEEEKNDDKEKNEMGENGEANVNNEGKDDQDQTSDEESEIENENEGLEDTQRSNSSGSVHGEEFYPQKTSSIIVNCNENEIVDKSEFNMEEPDAIEVAMSTMFDEVEKKASEEKEEREKKNCKPILTGESEETDDSDASADFSYLETLKQKFQLERNSPQSDTCLQELEQINQRVVDDKEIDTPTDKGRETSPEDKEEERLKPVVKVISNELLPPRSTKKIVKQIDPQGGGKIEQEQRQVRRRQEKRKKGNQKSITEFFSTANQSTDNALSMSDEEENYSFEIDNKSVSSHFSMSDNEETSKNEGKDSSKIRRQLINEVSHKIDRILSKDRHIGVTYGVDVNVKVKKINRRRKTDEELNISFRKCSNQQATKNDDHQTQVSDEETLPQHDDDSVLDDNSLEHSVEDNINTNHSKLLSNINIKLPWPVPPLHQIETRAATCPTSKERAEMKKLNIKIKNGNFTKKEDDLIKDNFEEFCRLSDIPTDPSPFLNFSHLKYGYFRFAERVQFVRFLAHGLDDRTLFSTYKRFQRLYVKDKVKSGRFTKNEDEIIMKYMKNPKSGTPFAHLAKILNRTKISVFRRHKILLDLEKDEGVKSKWNRERMETLVKHLLEATSCTNIEELKDRKVEREEWKKVSQKMNVSVDSLRQIWFSKIYIRLYIKSDLNLDTLRTQLTDLLLSQGGDDWANVDWNKVAQNFNGLTPQYLSKMFKAMVRQQVPQEKQTNLKECLEYLRDDKHNKRKIVLKKLDLDESLCDEFESSQE